MAFMFVKCETDGFSFQELFHDSIGTMILFLVLNHFKFSNDCRAQVVVSVIAFQVRFTLERLDLMFCSFFFN